MREIIIPFDFQHLQPLNQLYTEPESSLLCTLHLNICLSLDLQIPTYSVNGAFIMRFQNLLLLLAVAAPRLLAAPVADSCMSSGALLFNSPPLTRP